MHRSRTPFHAPRRLALAAAAALALATIPLGLTLSALAQLVALLVVLAGSLLVETRLAVTSGRHP